MEYSNSTIARLKLIILIYAIIHLVLTLIRPFYEIPTFGQFVLMGTSLLIGFVVIILIAFYKKYMSLKTFLIMELSLIVIIALPYLIFLGAVVNLH